MNVKVESRCNALQVGGNAFLQQNQLLFYGRCSVSRSWVVRTNMPTGIDSKINVTALSYTVREVGEGGGGSEYTRSMTRTGDVFLLRGREVSIIPTGSAAQAFGLTCTADVADSPTAPTETILSQGQVTIAAASNGSIVVPPWAKRLFLAVSGAATPIRVNFNSDNGATQSVNVINNASSTYAQGIIVPTHAISAQIFNDDALLPVIIHAQWTCFS